MPTIEIAEQPGVGPDGVPRPTEDRVLALDNAVLLLDGATASHPDLPAPAWYAGVLADRIARELTAAPDAPLPAVLELAIDGVRREHSLRPRHAPSSTVAMLRWTPERVDGLVLADSPIAILGPSTVDPVPLAVLADERLAVLRDAGRLRTVAEVDGLRNVEGGFWVAEADPAAARHAMLASWPIDAVGTAILASDGVSAGVDEYGLFDWRGVRELATGRGAKSVLDAVRAAESSDPDGIRWPRHKRHDDQSLAFVEFTR